MMTKVFARGTGAGKGPVNYCIDTVVPAFDPETRRRIPGQFVTRDPPPVVLAGDPDTTRQLIDSIDNKWKYTSGVVAFSKEDAPTQEEIQGVIRTFEEMAFAGLEKDQYDCLWIKHEHEGNIELHFVSPRAELGSGKALNIAPPGYLKMFDAWRDGWNFEKGWSRPDDPARARLVQMGDHEAKTDAARIKAGLEKSGPTKAKEMITDWLTERIKSGQVTDRAGVMASLAEIGTITKSGDTYISVQPEGYTKAFRLKGGIYGESFKSEKLVADLGIEESAGLSRGGQRDSARAEEARGRLREAVQHRADYNRSCYHPERYQINAERRAADRADAARSERAPGQDASPDRPAVATLGRASHEAAHGQVAGADQRPDQAIDRSAGEGQARRASPGTDDSKVMDKAGSVSANDLSSYLSRHLGTDAIPGTPDTEQPRDYPGATSSAGQPAKRDPERRAEAASVGSSLRGERREEVFSSGKKTEANPRWYEQLRQQLLRVVKVGKDLYDRARETVGRWIDESIQAIRGGHEAAAGASLAVATASAAVGQSGHQLVTASRAVDAATASQRSEAKAGLRPDVQHFERTAQRSIGVIKMNRDDELARFKTDINLIQYCAGCGYELDKTESSRTSTIMRRGGEKIGVAVDTDGHWVYSDLRNEGRGGSIIDFVQHTQGLNLGQVRKELRGAAGHIAQIPIAQRPRRPEPSSHSRQAVQHAYIKAKPTHGTHDYLENERGIQPEILLDPRFATMVKTDDRGNAIFPHYDDKGLSGYEIRGHDYKGFSKGGEKTIWHSTNLDTAKEVIFVEGAINALSYAQLHPTPDYAYVSIGGQMSDKQKQLVAGVMRDATSRGATLVFATDNDEAGEKHAQALKALAPPGAKIERDRPQPGMDWNEQALDLRAQVLEAERQYRQEQERARAPTRSRGMGMGR